MRRRWRLTGPTGRLSFSEDGCAKCQKPNALQQQRGLNPSGNDGRQAARSGQWQLHLNPLQFRFLSYPPLADAMPKLILLACSLCISFFVRAEDSAVEQLFRSADIDGTIVIESVRTGQRFVHNDPRSKQPFSAASTFKVLNTLIALEEGVISGADAIFQWDGTRYEIANWNNDQTLESAFKASCVWCYQQLARRVGAVKYPPYIQQSDYGQLRQPYNETEFWLDGSLTISAEQQVAFLRQIVERKLPFKASSYDTLKKIMLTDVTERYRLYAKTGWATRNVPSVGWYVGFVETSDDIWLFALNLVTRDAKDLPLRIQIAKDALKVKGALPSS